MKSLFILVSLAVVGFLALKATGCAVARPFRGPGVESIASGDSESDTVVVALTHVVLDNSQRSDFDAHVKRVVNALDSEPFDGFVGMSVRKEILGNEAWTMTVWRDLDAMKAFVHSKVHREAMVAGDAAIESMRFHHFEVASNEVPLSWDDALARLDAHSPLTARKTPSRVPQ